MTKCKFNDVKSFSFQKTVNVISISLIVRLIVKNTRGWVTILMCIIIIHYKLNNNSARVKVRFLSYSCHITGKYFLGF